MARDGFFADADLAYFADHMAAQGKYLSKRAKKMMRQQGTQLKRQTLRQIRLLNIRTITGNYKAGIQRGKVYNKDGATLIRVYSNAPHAHLIEDGHMVDTKKGPKKVKGRKVFASAAEAYAPKFQEACEDLLDEVINDICK